MREREHRIEIKAPIAAVWKALVDANEVARWFAPEVEIEPKQGGRYRISWGESWTGEGRIEELVAEERFKLVHTWEGAAGLDPPLIEEYLLEARGDVVVLRLVQSGIPDSADWDDFYEDTGRGWKMYLAALKHYVEKHLGTVRETIMFMQPISIPVEDAWQKLVGPDGLATDGALQNVAVGTRTSVTTTFGQKLEVGVLVHEPPHTLSMTIDNLEDSLLALDFERIGGKTFLYANLSTFGLGASQVTDLKAQWKTWIERLFPVATGASA